MNTNITADNYEAYLLDYMEGNLSPERAKQLKAFITAQGLDWNEVTEELPHLEASDIVYESKEKLKKKGAIIPLYVKIASAAAAAGLLLTVSLWPEKSLPKMEPIANLKPIEVSHINSHEPMTLLPRRSTESMSFQQRPMRNEEAVPSGITNKGGVTSERASASLLAELPTKNITAIQTDLLLTNFDEPDFDFLDYRMNNDLDFDQYTESSFDYFSDYDKDERELSFIAKGLLLLTNGRHDSFASLISSGLSTAKNEISLAATDLALTAYHRADESLEEMKENWQEKWGD